MSEVDMSVGTVPSVCEISARNTESLSTACRQPDNKQDYVTSQSKTKETANSDVSELLESVPQLANAFNIKDKIGSGTFSSVYLASLKTDDTGELFALKHLVPTSHPSRIEKELRCLKDIGGECHVIAVRACVRHNDHVIVVMPYFEHDRFQDYVHDMSVSEVRDYMKALLTSVGRVHKYNVIHRDIKHSNFLYNRKLKRYALVDFGLAQEVPEGLRRTAQQSSSLKPPNSESKPVDENMIETMVTSDSEAGNVPSSSFSSVMLPSSTQKPDRSGQEKMDESSCTMLRPLSPNVKLTRPGRDIIRSAVGGKLCEKSPRRALLTKRALDIGRRTAGTDGAVSSGMHNASDRLPASRAVETTARKDRSPCAKAASCRCFGRPMVCTVCLSRAVLYRPFDNTPPEDVKMENLWSTERAPRAGTPGYRAPEVLMKFANQTTAVDIWAVGVIFLSLLSSHYPIFKASDDMEALAQIVAIFGSDAVKAAAKSYGKRMDCSPAVPPTDIKTLCSRLRQRVQRSPNDVFPDSAFDLLRRLMDLNPFTRTTAAEALAHKYFTESP